MSVPDTPQPRRLVAALADFDPATLAQQFVDWGHKPSHAARVLRAFYEGDGQANPTVSGLPAELVERLRTGFAPSAATLAVRQVAADGTTKLLLRLGDGRTVESVLMPDFRADRAAGCVSSQVGCAMGCDFCATTKTGFERNLTAGKSWSSFWRCAARRTRSGAACKPSCSWAWASRC